MFVENADLMAECNPCYPQIGCSFCLCCIDYKPQNSSYGWAKRLLIQLPHLGGVSGPCKPPFVPEHKHRQKWQPALQLRHQVGAVLSVCMFHWTLLQRTACEAWSDADICLYKRYPCQFAQVYTTVLPFLILFAFSACYIAFSCIKCLV